MKKRLLALVISAAMAVGMLAGCAVPAAGTAGGESAAAPAAAEAEAQAEEAAEPAGEGGFKIALNVPTTQYEFFAKIGTDLEALGKEQGFEVYVDSCDGDLSRQADQMQNYISMGVDYVAVVPVETFGLIDAMTQVKAAGIKVINLLGSIADYPDAYDLGIIQDNKAVGAGAAELASDWINATFPDAEDGSIEVAIFEKNTDPEAQARSQGLYEIENLNSKCKVVVNYDFANTTDTQQKAQEYATEMFVQHPDVKLVLCYQADMTTAVDEVCLTENIAEPDKFAIFSVDWTDLLGQKLAGNADNSSYIRGTSACWVNLAGNIVALIKGELPVNEYNEYSSGSWKVTLDTLEEYCNITGIKLQ